MRFAFGGNEAGQSHLRKDGGMTTMTEERPIFENEGWLVTESGLEHKATGYFIDRESLANRRSDGLWTWPLHMAEKSWCEMAPFAEAFSCAASVYDIETGADLAHTFKLARCEIAAWPQQAKRHLTHPPMVPRPLRSAERDPILWEPGRPEDSLRNQGSQTPSESPRRQTSARGFSTNARTRAPHFSLGRAKVFPWRTSRRIQQTGTKLVRLLQAAWNTE
jgi:hypothetical protein